ncbi:MAG: UspA domain protein [Gemmatimonadetes bacterium]|nr:UspA domain protein [Gemmatimonadota bacterium]
MYRSLLVPLDGSSFAEQALPMAVEIAVRSGATLHLVLVHNSIAVVPGPGEPVVLDPAVDDASRRQEEEYLASVSRPLTGQGVRQVVTRLLDGPTAETIATYARASVIDLVVLTTHGRGILSRFWIGSVADRLVRQLEQPILLVRPQAARGAPSPAMIRRVLVPLDGSPLAAAMIEPATSFGELLGAEFMLYRAVVLPPPVWLPLPGVIIPPEDAGTPTKLELEATRYLHQVAQQLRLKGLTVETAVEVAPDPVAAIAAHAERHGADVIALATHGYGGATRFLLGSVADKLLRTATVPLLVWRPGVGAEPGAVRSMEFAAVP